MLERIFGRPGKPMAVAVAGAADPLAQYPGAFDVGPADRRAWWAARAFAVLSLLLAIVAATLGFALLTLMPLKEKELVLVQLHPQTQQVVEMQPLRIGAPGLDIATRGWVAEWLQRRHEVVPDDSFMRQAVLWVQLRSDPGVRSAFELESRRFIDEAIKQKVTRRCVVDTGSVNQQAPGLWVVRFELVDSDAKGTELARATWSGTVRVEFRPQSATRGETDKSAASANPFGFTVLEYTRVRS